MDKPVAIQGKIINPDQAHMHRTPSTKTRTQEV